jgi:hypoxanthine-guanine phosphoribosyltransferase
MDHGVTNMDFLMSFHMAHMASASPTMNMPMDMDLEDMDMVIDADIDDPGDAVVALGEGLRNTE